MVDIEQQVEALCCGAEAVYSRPELADRLKSAAAAGRPLRVKLGMDPSSPHLHLGHSVVLRKLRQFQDFGHKAVLIIGDYTARVGDPTGKNKTRPMLSPDQIDANAKTYFDQAGHILDTSADKLEIRRNSEWLAQLSFADTIKLAAKMTVAQMLERDSFAKRYATGEPISIHELLYPLMQGQDSVAIRSDVELGGSDQTFNCLVGRRLQTESAQAAQIVLTMPILVGLDGTEKMSKSLGNDVQITAEPNDMFGKVMSIPDTLMANYFTLLTSRPAGEIQTLLAGHPRQAKATLARDIVASYYGDAAATAASDEWDRVKVGGELPSDMNEVAVPASLPLMDLVVACKFAASKSEARRKIEQGGVKLNGERLADWKAIANVKAGDVLQVGSKHYARLRVRD
ncbi:MAG: tyrosine--tRNA ligase [Phycisphaerae bacterium]|nr:tyrosine--tRNA ligase [Phycisphaerae bacterium]